MGSTKQRTTCTTSFDLNRSRFLVKIKNKKVASRHHSAVDNAQCLVDKKDVPTGRTATHSGSNFG